MTTPPILLSESLRGHARKRPEEVALYAQPGVPNSPQSGASPTPRKDGRYCWGELDAWVDSLADQLRIHRRGDSSLRESFVQSEVGRCGPAFVHTISNDLEDILVALACPRAGLTEIAIDAWGGERYVHACERAISDACGPVSAIPDSAKRELVWRSHRLAGRVISRHQPISAERDALVLFTSGTSGAPKGVRLSHRALAYNAAAKLEAVPQTSQDHRLTVLSIAHAYARTCDLGTWLLSGCSLEIGRGLAAWQAATSNRDGDIPNPTLCNTVPSLASRMQEARSLGALRLLGCGGAAMAEDSFHRWRERGVVVIQGYGMTEAGPVIASQTPDDSIPGRVGRLVSGWQTRIENERLWVRGPHLMTGYLQQASSAPAPEKRENASPHEETTGPPWLDTGDLVHRCETSGQLQILGRGDDRIVLSNGHLVDPASVERQLTAIPGVRTAFVAPTEDRRQVRWWIESDQPRIENSQLINACNELPLWQEPAEVIEFSVPDAERPRVFNHKGAVRRQAMAARIESYRRRGPATPPA